MFRLTSNTQDVILVSSKNPLARSERRSRLSVGEGIGSLRTRSDGRSRSREVPDSDRAIEGTGAESLDR